MVLAKMDEIGRPAWLVAVVAGFWLFWPIGLATLGYLAWTGRLRSMRREGRGQWHNIRAHAFGGTFGSTFGGGSGNKAFDEYRSHTLQRLEEEQAEFVSYLDRLRQARDKAEFDQFMAERGRRSDVVVDVTEQRAA